MFRTYSAASSNNINYEVVYNRDTERFTISEDGTSLDQLQLLWNSGTNNALGAASELGYNPAADNLGASTYTGVNAVTMFTVTAGTNDTINFKEILPGRTAEDDHGRIVLGQESRPVLGTGRLYAHLLEHSPARLRDALPGIT